MFVLTDTKKSIELCRTDAREMANRKNVSLKEYTQLLLVPFHVYPATCGVWTFIEIFTSDSMFQP